MPKYVSRTDFEANAPKAWAKYTDPEVYEDGMNTIAPSGKSLKPARKKAYDEHTGDKEAKKWLDEFDAAMFG